MTESNPAVQFFYDRVAYCWDTAAGQTEQAGHLMSALDLANAEQVAARQGWGVNWPTDEATGTEFAVLEDADGLPLASLDTVAPGASADLDFRRVVTAQLALNVIQGLDNPQREEQPNQ